MAEIEDRINVTISNEDLIKTVEKLYLRIIKLYKSLYQDYIDLNVALDNYDKAVMNHDRREKTISTLTISQILVDITDKTITEVKIYKDNCEEYYLLPYLREYILRRFDIDPDLEVQGLTYFDIYTKKELAVFKDKPIIIRMLRAIDYFTLFEEEKESYIDTYNIYPDDITIKSNMELDYADVLALNTLTYVEMPRKNKEIEFVDELNEESEESEEEKEEVIIEENDLDIGKTEEQKKQEQMEISRCLNKYKCLLAFTNLGVENKLLNEDFILDKKFRTLETNRFFQSMMTDSIVLALLEIQKNPILEIKNQEAVIKKQLSLKDKLEILLHFKNYDARYKSRKEMFEYFYIDNFDNLLLLSSYINQCYMQIGLDDFNYLDQLLNMSADNERYTLNDEVIRKAVVDMFFNNNQTSAVYRRIRNINKKNEDSEE